MSVKKYLILGLTTLLSALGAYAQSNMAGLADPLTMNNGKTMETKA